MSSVLGILGALQTVGSVFVKRDGAGKAEVAAAPWVILFVAGSMLGCYSQTSEPFSVCVKTMFSVLGG